MSSEIDQEIADLLAGKKDSSDPTTAYIVNVLREASEEKDRLQRDLQSVEQRLNQLRSRLVELQGVGKRSVDDLRKILSQGKCELSVIEGEQEKE